jgi:hypothetical protein
MTDPIDTRWATPEGTPPGSVPPAPAPALGAPPKKKGGNLANALLVVAAVIAVGGIAFAIGRATAPAAASGFRGNGQGFARGSFDPGAADNGQGGQGFGRGGAITVSGTVTTVSGSTMTMTTANGQTITIDLSGSTYHAQAPATASDLATGTSVKVEIQGFGGGFRPGASGAPDASGAPGAGQRTITATEVTIVSQ